MRNINNDLTLKRNYLNKYRFLINEYELVKRGEHSQFKFAKDFYAAHDTDPRYEAIACYTGRKCIASLYSSRLPHCVRNDTKYDYNIPLTTPPSALKAAPFVADDNGLAT